MSDKTKTKGANESKEKQVKCSLCGDVINPDSHACATCGHEEKP